MAEPEKKPRTKQDFIEKAELIMDSSLKANDMPTALNALHLMVELEQGYPDWK